MQYWILHHQHKGKPIEQALVNQGWVYSQTPDIALFDVARGKPIERRFRREGASLVIYPHTAIAGWWYDGLLEPPIGFDAILVVGEGQAVVIVWWTLGRGDGRRGRRQSEMVEDASQDGGVGQERDDDHGGCAACAGQCVHVQDTLEEAGPGQMPGRMDLGLGARVTLDSLGAGPWGGVGSGRRARRIRPVSRGGLG